MRESDAKRQQGQVNAKRVFRGGGGCGGGKTVVLLRWRGLRECGQNIVQGEIWSSSTGRRLPGKISHRTCKSSHRQNLLGGQRASGSG